MQYKNDNAMPTIFILFGFPFMFCANDHEPIHVHVVKGRIKAKFTLSPVKTVYNKKVVGVGVKNG